ncbi:hypothetical protein DFH08DRAFT_720529, partial [Mycena albidolilacea]
KKPTAIANDLQMLLRIVQRVLILWKMTRAVCQVCKGLGRGCLMCANHCDVFIIALIECQPNIYLDEIQLQLIIMYDLHVSLPTLSRTLCRLGYTNKKLSCVAAERNPDKIRTFTHKIGQYPPHYSVFADEAAVNTLTTYRSNRWSLCGLRAHKHCKFVCGTR